MFKGTYTALVTPFRNGTIDEAALARLIEHQIAAGIDGIVPVGTSGESPTLDIEEHIHVIELSVKFAAGKTKVIAGTGANSTSEAIELTEAAEKAGADAALIVAPYYNKPSQVGLFEHFSAIADKTKLPIVLYSIPSRCGVEIAVDTVVKLASSVSNIVAIKEAGGSVDRVSQLKQVLPDSFDIISGDDSLTLPFISVGAVGVISVASNVAPAAVKKMVDFALRGDFVSAGKEHYRLYPLFRDLFVETNPTPVKAALASLGLIHEELRLPLVPISDASREKLHAALRQLGILK